MDFGYHSGYQSALPLQKFGSVLRIWGRHRTRRSIPANTPSPRAATRPYAGRLQPFPPIMTGGSPQSASDGNPPPFQTLATVEADDYGLETADDTILTTGATGLPKNSIDHLNSPATPINERPCYPRAAGPALSVP